MKNKSCFFSQKDYFSRKIKSNRIQLVCFDPKVNLKAAVSIFLLEDALFRSCVVRLLFVFSKLSWKGNCSENLWTKNWTTFLAMTEMQAFSRTPRKSSRDNSHAFRSRTVSVASTGSSDSSGKHVSHFRAIVNLTFISKLSKDLFKMSFCFVIELWSWKAASKDDGWPWKIHERRSICPIQDQ